MQNKTLLEKLTSEGKCQERFFIEEQSFIEKKSFFITQLLMN
mgnify:CR=1 FL=1